MSNFTQEDRDMLVRVDERTKIFTERFAKHVSIHWKVGIPVGMLLAGLLIALLTK